MIFNKFKLTIWCYLFNFLLWLKICNLGDEVLTFNAFIFSCVNLIPSQSISIVNGPCFLSCYPPCIGEIS